MKYVVILGDGMADYRQSFLGDKTPLMIANKPFIDSLARESEAGLCQTVPCSLKPGSDVANLSVLGYNPLECYSGRSPLEAASIGIDLKETDITARANLVTVSDEKEYADKTMIDYSAGEISTQEATELINYLRGHLNNQKYTLYAGISYRQCIVIEKGSLMGDLTPPHDITGKPIKGHLPTSDGGKELFEIMKKSYELLKDHPINKKRIAEGKNPANSLWFWGDGTKPNLQSFYDKFALKGGIISAVDLLKGIGKLAKMQVIEVEGATGNYDTNFVGKANACVKALSGGLDFVYLHMEAPDECGHHGDAKNKVYSIEQIDNVVKIIHDGLKQMGEDFAFLILPDHPTPLSIMTHCSDPVPYILYNSKESVKGIDAYDEENTAKTGIFEKEGYKLIQKLFSIK